MCPSYTHGRDPGKLGNSPQWPKPPPSIPSVAKDKKGVCVGGAVWGGDQDKHPNLGHGGYADLKCCLFPSGDKTF